MKDMIETLSKEYIELHHKLNGVANLIKVYGGKLPSIPGHQYSEAVLEGLIEDVTAYPIGDTWKEKIKFVLKEAGKPSTVGTLSEIIKKHEPDTEMTKIVNALTQTCSAMAAKGDIGVEKGFKNKYFLKEETTPV
jgi:hypothetical protein